MRISTLFVCVIAVAGLAVSSAAKAGDDYRDSALSAGYSGGHYRTGYASRHAGSGYSRGTVSYSTSCCYQKVVRHYSTTRYVRVDVNRHNEHRYHRPVYRSAYHAPPRRRYVHANYYAPPRYDHYQAPSRYVSYGRYGYGGGYAARVSYGPECTTRRVRVYDGYGGWVWVARRICN